MTASLGGVDAVVFTAGIGENSAEVRHAACAKLGFLGIGLDREKNGSAQPDVDIADAGSMVRVLVIRAQEDWAIARKCVRFSSQ
jgi:acetate kinase